MLQHGVDPPNAIAAPSRVMGSDNRLQDVAPVHRGFFILGIDFRQVAIPSGLDHPEFQWRLVGIESNGSTGIRTANALLADSQPVVAWHILGFNETQCRSRSNWCCRR